MLQDSEIHLETQDGISQPQNSFVLINFFIAMLDKSLLLKNQIILASSIKT